MSPDICYCFEDQELDEVAANMADVKVRRLSVVNSEKRLVLLCHKLRRERPFVFAPQHGQRERMATSFAMSRRRMVAIELGT